VALEVFVRNRNVDEAIDARQQILRFAVERLIDVALMREECAESRAARELLRRIAPVVTCVEQERRS